MDANIWTPRTFLSPWANDNGDPSFILAQCRYVPRLSENEDIWENQLAFSPALAFFE